MERNGDEREKLKENNSNKKELDWSGCKIK